MLSLKSDLLSNASFAPLLFACFPLDSRVCDDQLGRLYIQLQERGLTEETLSSKKVKTYLWRQDLIARFNADGKKAKSKGNHIWNIDAKRLPTGRWVFRPFKRKIMGNPPPFA